MAGQPGKSNVTADVRFRVWGFQGLGLGLIVRSSSRFVWARHTTCRAGAEGGIRACEWGGPLMVCVSWNGASILMSTEEETWTLDPDSETAGMLPGTGAPPWTLMLAVTVTMPTCRSANKQMYGGSASTFCQTSVR